MEKGEERARQRVNRHPQRQKASYENRLYFRSLSPPWSIHLLTLWGNIHNGYLEFPNTTYFPLDLISPRHFYQRSRSKISQQVSNDWCCHFLPGLLFTIRREGKTNKQTWTTGSIKIHDSNLFAISEIRFSRRALQTMVNQYFFGVVSYPTYAPSVYIHVIFHK